jgi:hypothetical protein
MLQPWADRKNREAFSLCPRLSFLVKDPQVPAVREHAPAPAPSQFAQHPEPDQSIDSSSRGGIRDTRLPRQMVDVCQRTVAQRIKDAQGIGSGTA